MRQSTTEVNEYGHVVKSGPIVPGAEVSRKSYERNLKFIVELFEMMQQRADRIGPMIFMDARFPDGTWAPRAPKRFTASTFYACSRIFKKTQRETYVKHKMSEYVEYDDFYASVTANAAVARQLSAFILPGTRYTFKWRLKVVCGYRHRVDISTRELIKRMREEFTAAGVAVESCGFDGQYDGQFLRDPHHFYAVVHFHVQ